MKILTLLALLLILPAATAYGQGEMPPASRSQRTRKGIKPHTAKYGRVHDPLPLKESADEIQAMRPAVSDGTLNEDMYAVIEARPYVRDIFRVRGFQPREADDALMCGWEQLRITQLKPTERLSPQVLINYLSGYGKVIIKTKPAGAVVVIGNKMLPDKTEAVSWSSAGTHHIKLSMNGYETVEETCAVEEGKTTVFERTLKPLNRKTVTRMRRKN